MNNPALLILYKYNDMSSVFYEASTEDWNIVTPRSIDFLSNYIPRGFIAVFGIITGVNLLTLLYMALSIFSNYLLFNNVQKNRALAVLFSLVNTLSIYFLFRIISFTPNLYPIFIFPLTLYLLLKNTKPFYLGLLNFLFLCLSSYYAFFNTILVGLWYLLDKKLLNVAKFLIPVIIGVVLFFLPYLKQNSYLGNYDKTASNTVYRPIEDWYNFSFRPWYFVIPPSSSVFFGNLHNAFYDKLKSTGNYFTQNYTEDEMAGAYMGWHFIVGTVVMFYLSVIKKSFGTQDERRTINKCFLIIGAILLISGPPSFNVGGLKIYTPSYPLYYLVPVFRTLVRWSAVIYLLVLVINYYLVVNLYSRVRGRLCRVAFVLAFVALNFVVFAIKIPVINVGDPPQDVRALTKLDGRSLVFYPEGDYYSLFWSQVFKKEILNPKNVDVGTLSPKEFTASLLTYSNTDLF